MDSGSSWALSSTFGNKTNISYNIETAPLSAHCQCTCDRHCVREAIAHIHHCRPSLHPYSINNKRGRGRERALAHLAGLDCARSAAHMDRTTAKERSRECVFKRANDRATPRKRAREQAREIANRRAGENKRIHCVVSLRLRCAPIHPPPTHPKSTVNHHNRNNGPPPHAQHKRFSHVLLCSTASAERSIRVAARFKCERMCVCARATTASFRQSGCCY